MPDPPGWRRPGDPALDAWQLAEYQAAADTLAARGGHVVWIDVPCAKTHAIDTHERALWFVDHRTIPRLAAARPIVHVVDLERRDLPAATFTADFGGVAGRPPRRHALLRRGRAGGRELGDADRARAGAAARDRVAKS